MSDTKERVMYAAERQKSILAMAREEGRVEGGALAEVLDVTVETIRRDLAALEKRGLVRRVHGGALPIERPGFEPSLTDRTSQNLEEKDAIATAAIKLIDDGVRTVLLDAGSTTTALARKVASIASSQRELTVVTNSISVASIVASRPGIHLHMLGGAVRPRTLACVGDAAVAQLRHLAVDVAFLGINGLDESRGLTTPDVSEAAVKRAMKDAANSVIVLADSSKLGQTHLAQVARLDEVDTVITDASADLDLVESIATQGPEVIAA